MELADVQKHSGVERNIENLRNAAKTSKCFFFKTDRDIEKIHMGEIVEWVISDEKAPEKFLARRTVPTLEPFKP